MQLAQLLSPWYSTEQVIDATAPIGDLRIDSRTIVPGDVFCALARDTEVQKKHIAEAINAGAICVLVDASSSVCAEAMPRVVAVPELAQQLVALADKRYGNPKLTLLAVTGTNGKTSVAWMGAQLLTTLGLDCGYIGTLGATFGNQHWPGTLTTPDIFSLRQLLARMRQAGAQACFIEASSHALDQGRLDGLAFALGVFTNLSLDHLDYHGDMESYRLAKWKLWSQCARLVANSDDTHYPLLPAHTPLIGFGTQARGSSNHLTLTKSNSDANGTQWQVRYQGRTQQLHSPLIGRIMLENLLAIHAVALALNYQSHAIVQAIARVKAPPGRMEVVHSRPQVVVDYAHTPDALHKILQSLRHVIHQAQRLGVVFGCGGNRDIAKRPLMGAIAASLADKVFVTSDNPRHESPESIIQAITSGIAVADLHKVTCQTDREKAITMALDWCQNDDWLVIAGKGHETTQIIGGVHQKFNDRQLVQAYFSHDR